MYTPNCVLHASASRSWEGSRVPEATEGSAVFPCGPPTYPGRYGGPGPAGAHSWVQSPDEATQEPENPLVVGQQAHTSGVGDGEKPIPLTGLLIDVLQVFSHRGT